MTRQDKITADSTPLVGNLAGAVTPPIAPATLHTGPFDTEGRLPQPLDPWAANGGLVAADERRDTASAVGGQPERGSVMDADAGLSTASPVRVLRVPGEAFDADQVTPPCEQCGLNEYACECEDPWGYGPTKSREEIEANYRAALDRIARVFLGVPS